MSQQKLTDRTELNETPHNDDVIHIVDVSDTTHSPEGTSKKIKYSNLKNTPNQLTSDLSVIDLSNYNGSYSNMDSASNTETLTINESTKTLGGVYFRLINTVNEPTVTGALKITKGDAFSANSDMYLVCKYNGFRSEFWFESIGFDLETYTGLPYGAIIAESQTPSTDYVGDPLILKMSNGNYIMSHSIFGSGADNKKTFIYKTTDLSSNNWVLKETLTDFIWGSMIEHSNVLYFIGVTDYPTGGNIMVTKSEDYGETWSAQVQVLSIPSGYIGWHTSVINPLIKDGYLCKSFELRTSPFTWASSHEICLVFADVSDLMNPSNWSVGNKVLFNGAEFENNGIYSNTSESKYPPPAGQTVSKGFLESGIIEKSNGDLIVMSRLEQTPNSNNAVYLDVTWDSVNPNLSTLGSTHNFIEMPGGHIKFQVLWDSVSSKHWSVVNLNKYKYYSDGRIEQYLISSSDNCATWEVHQKTTGFDVTSNWESEIEQYGVQYAHFIIDGDNLLIADRTADVNADDWHNANLLTLTKIEDFRDITPISYVNGSLIIDENSNRIEDVNGISIMHDQSKLFNSPYMLNADNASKVSWSSGLNFTGSEYMRAVHNKNLNLDNSTGLSVFIVVENIQSLSSQRYLSKATGAGDVLSKHWFYAPNTGMGIQDTRASYSDLTTTNDYIFSSSYDNVNEFLYNYLNGSNRGAPDSVNDGVWNTDHIELSTPYASGNFDELIIGGRVAGSLLGCDSKIKAIHIIPNYMTPLEMTSYITNLNDIYTIY